MNNNSAVHLVRG